MNDGGRGALRDDQIPRRFAAAIMSGVALGVVFWGGIAFAVIR